jgi:SAM-dependent methyltransferase
MGILRGPRSGAEVTLSPQTPRVSHSPRPSRGKETVDTRQSRGLEQFFASFRDQTGLSILDLGGARQQNINFITSLGHKFYSEDFLHIFQDTFGEDVADQSNSGRIEYFLREGLEYPDEQFDGVLAWDVLEHMEPPLLLATTERLWRVLKPKGYLLALFQSADRKGNPPFYEFRIQDLRTLEVTQHGERSGLPQLFNNRSLEKLFAKFESVKFFLTRDHLREVIVRK